MAFHNLRIKDLLRLLSIPFFPALGLWLLARYSGTPFTGWIWFTRVYAYVALGSSLVTTTRLFTLAAACEQDLHLPASLIFKALSLLNELSRLRQQLIAIRNAANLRGVHLTLFSPQLYFKTLVTAVHQIQRSQRVMKLRGFVKGQPRTHSHTVSLTKLDWLKAALLLAALQFFV